MKHYKIPIPLSQTLIDINPPVRIDTPEPSPSRQPAGNRGRR
jgi:hypothetical protein